MLSRCVLSQVKHNSYFLAGAALGLWLALAAVPLGDELAPCVPADPAPAPQTLADDYSPELEARPAGAGAGSAGGQRSVQRPRYYTTELGMRGALLAGVLTSHSELDGRVAALNRTLWRLQPALRFFMAAPGAEAGVAGRANVVGFTDAREMLKPFHALKYLADNYLDEYEYFFLVSDAVYVNARRLLWLAARVSVAQHVYLGRSAGDDTHYCTLEGGILLSNSVVRAVHGELDWCVRNAYSPHHHENIGRCVLHAAHTQCQHQAQGEEYVSVSLSGEEALTPLLAEAVTAHPVLDPEHMYRLHAYTARVSLELEAASVSVQRASVRRSGARGPPGARNRTWPAGLRADAGLADTKPDSRFDHARWTWFNASHALLPDDRRAVAEHARAHAHATQVVMSEAIAWAERRWCPAPGAGGAAGGGTGASRPCTVSLVEGGRQWQPARALRYRLVLRVQPRGEAEAGHCLRVLEVCRALGSARLVSVPYVTESARVTLLAVARGGQPGGEDVQHARRLLQRHEAQQQHQQQQGGDANTQLLIVCVHSGNASSASCEPLREHAAALAARRPRLAVHVLDTGLDAGLDTGLAQQLDAGRAAVAAATAAGVLHRDALLLLTPPNIEYNEEFLNRVRMNSIPGTSWYQPVGFARHALYAHARFRDASGLRPATGTGRFNAAHTDVLAFYRKDYDTALSSWSGGSGGSVSAVLSGAGAWLRCVRAPEPALVRVPPAGPPCGPRAQGGPCARAHFPALELGARAQLARLLLETQADTDTM